MNSTEKDKNRSPFHGYQSAYDDAVQFDSSTVYIFDIVDFKCIAYVYSGRFWYRPGGF